jgi:hypothetical protein
LKRLDVWIIAGVFAVAAAAFFAVSHFGGAFEGAGAGTGAAFEGAGAGGAGTGAVAEVYVKNELVRTLDLSEDGLVEVEDAGAYNLLEVKDGTIRMAEANCPSQTCVHTGAKSAGGSMIVCLPNRVVVKITGAPEEVDSVAN